MFRTKIYRCDFPPDVVAERLLKYIRTHDRLKAERTGSPLHEKAQLSLEITNSPFNRRRVRSTILLSVVKHAGHSYVFLKETPYFLKTVFIILCFSAATLLNILVLIGSRKFDPFRLSIFVGPLIVTMIIYLQHKRLTKRIERALRLARIKDS